MIVLDASIILKWVWAHEPQSQIALAYRDRHLEGTNPIAVPELAFYEIANALATKTSLSLEEGIEEFTAIVNAELESYSLSLDAFTQAIRLSKRFKISLYDSSYMALAAALRCEFITADAHLASKVKSLTYVKLLK